MYGKSLVATLLKKNTVGEGLLRRRCVEEEDWRFFKWKRAWGELPEPLHDRDRAACGHAVKGES